MKRRSQVALEYAFVAAFAVLVAVMVMFLVIQLALKGAKLAKEEAERILEQLRVLGGLIVIFFF